MSEEQRLLIQKSKEFAERVLIDGVIEGSTKYNIKNNRVRSIINA